MCNKDGPYFLKNFEQVPIYIDKYMDKDMYLVGYKSPEILSPGYVHVPLENFKDCKASVIEKEEVDKKFLQRKMKDRNFSDIKFIICNIEENEIDKLVESINKNFNTNV